MSLLTVKDLSLSFDKHEVLTHVHLSVDRGKIVTLIGPNGAGKSTLVRAILGLIPKSSGEIILAPDLRIGYMPQKLHIEPYLPLSALRFLTLAGRAKPEKAAFTSVVKLLSIGELLETPLQSVSGGEFQRILLARALLNKPDLLVLDEPMQGLDVLGQEALYTLIMQIRDMYNCGILMVSHDLHLVMAGTDFVICLNKHVCCSGNPETVTHDPEFLSMFGFEALNNIAVYAHRHDHRHDHPHHDTEASEGPEETED